MALKLLALAGIACVVAGCALLNIPAALIVTGGFLLFFAYTEG